MQVLSRLFSLYSGDLSLSLPFSAIPASSCAPRPSLCSSLAYLATRLEFLWVIRARGFSHGLDSPRGEKELEQFFIIRVVIQRRPFFPSLSRTTRSLWALVIKMIAVQLRNALPCNVYRSVYIYICTGGNRFHLWRVWREKERERDVYLG